MPRKCSRVIPLQVCSRQGSALHHQHFLPDHTFKMSHSHRKPEEDVSVRKCSCCRQWNRFKRAKGRKIDTQKSPMNFEKNWIPVRHFPLQLVNKLTRIEAIKKQYRYLKFMCKETLDHVSFVNTRVKDIEGFWLSTLVSLNLKDGRVRR
jgi:hypothetical protein